MLNDALSAAKVAEFLLDIGAVKLNPEHPFSWASGWKSPIYCDNRKTLAFPEVRDYLKKAMVSGVQRHFPETEMVIGVATGGIALGALVADEMGLPYGYVRSKAKGHGMQNRVEGADVSGKRVVVIEDLISTAGSSLSAIAALHESGASIQGMMAIFTYGFELSKERLTEAEVPYRTLSDYSTLLDVGLLKGSIDTDQKELLESWREQPETWNVAV